jgi:hypothetical protein
MNKKTEIRELATENWRLIFRASVLIHESRKALSI